MPAPLRIALADDPELFLESLSALFANAGGEIKVLWNARSSETCRLLMQEFPNLGGA